MSIETRQTRSGPSYRCRWRDRSGAHRSRTFSRKVDAVEFESMMRLEKRRRGLGPDPGSMTIDGLAREWTRLHVIPNLAPATRQGYAVVYDKHIGPHVGGVRVSDFGVREAKDFQADLRHRTKDATARKAMNVLSSIFTHAVETGLLEVHPIRHLPKGRVSATRPSVALSPSQVESLAAWFELKGRPGDAIIVKLMAYAGHRPGELRALTWGDVQEGSIQVWRAASLDEIGPTKTGFRRRIALLQPLREDLEAYRQMRDDPAPEAHVILRDDGQFVGHEDWKNWQRRWFRKAAKELKLPTTSPYNLRHSFASLLLQGDLPPTQVAEQLGHSTATLYRFYAHVIADFRGVQATPPEEAIRSARGERVPKMFPERREPGLRAGRKARSHGKPTSGFEPLTPSLRGVPGEGSVGVLMSLVSQEALQIALHQWNRAADC